MSSKDFLGQGKTARYKIKSNNAYKEKRLLKGMKITKIEEMEIKALKKFFESEGEEDEEEGYIHIAG